MNINVNDINTKSNPADASNSFVYSITTETKNITKGITVILIRRKALVFSQYLKTNMALPFATVYNYVPITDTLSVRRETDNVQAPTNKCRE